MFSDSLREELSGIARADRAGSPLQDRVAQLFERTRGDVYRYLLILGLDPAQAQEATQEVFLRLYITLRRNQEVQNPRAWIFRVAHNLGLKIRSKQAAQQPFDAELETRLLDPQSTPEMAALERERAVRFHRAVESLSEQQRRCLFLRLEGLRYPEIGDALGISTSAVGEFLRRAIVKLKRLSHD